jgi:hypothetical protein
MRITDIIRGVLDLADMAGAASAPVTPAVIAVAEPEPKIEQEAGADEDMIAILQKLAGMDSGCDAEPEYANQPQETVAPLAAAFPGGDDVHSRKNPADIRTNAPSMYPGYQAGAR